MTNAEARFNKSLRPRKPEGSLGRTAQDVHLDSHTAPELCRRMSSSFMLYVHRNCRAYQGRAKNGVGNESPGPLPCSVHTARER